MTGLRHFSRTSFGTTPSPRSPSRAIPGSVNSKPSVGKVGLLRKKGRVELMVVRVQVSMMRRMSKLLRRGG